MNISRQQKINELMNRARCYQTLYSVSFSNGLGIESEAVEVILLKPDATRLTYVHKDLKEHCDDIMVKATVPEMYDAILARQSLVAMTKGDTK